MHKEKYGRALNETGTAQLRRQAAHRAQAPQSGTVVDCCAVSCFDLPSYLFYAVLLLDICEFFFVLCYSEYLIFVYVIPVYFCGTRGCCRERKKRRQAYDVRPNETFVILSPPHICR